MTDPVIRSLLDTDLYKFTMMQAVLHHFPAAEVEYRFKCRTPDIDFRACIDNVREEIKTLCSLRFDSVELTYLAGLDYISRDFVEFLRLFQFNSRFIDLQLQGCDLELSIRGPWLHCILFEVPLLAIISECYFRKRIPNPDFQCGRDRLHYKIRQVLTHPLADGFFFSDFGTRRRFSRIWHQEVVATLRDQIPRQLVGTSNVDLARRLRLLPIGTMAHEFLQGCQALGPRLADSQKFALETWTKEYRGRLGIALTDVVGVDAFLRDFDLYFAKLFDGLRHDSGDPFRWADQVIAHYQDLKIDPKTKTLVFSDRLNFDRALAIYGRYQQLSNPVFGIGTNLTNDLSDDKLDIVIKMTRCNHQPVAKISDSPGKSMCDDDAYLSYLAKVFKLPPPSSDS
jgi:nicotinate phosphoribosyltransferase